MVTLRAMMGMGMYSTFFGNVQNKLQISLKKHLRKLALFTSLMVIIELPPHIMSVKLKDRLQLRQVKLSQEMNLSTFS